MLHRTMRTGTRPARPAALKCRSLAALARRPRNPHTLPIFPMNHPTVKARGTARVLPNLIFASRWLQLPLYIGLIAAQAI